jgi:hypothetical protein
VRCPADVFPGKERRQPVSFSERWASGHFSASKLIKALFYRIFGQNINL